MNVNKEADLLMLELDMASCMVDDSNYYEEYKQIHHHHNGMV